MDSPDGTRKQANANKQNDRKSLGRREKLQKNSGEDDRNGNPLDQNDIDSLAKEQPSVVLQWEILLRGNGQSIKAVNLPHQDKGGRTSKE
jgi:hypothetical protein